ncbi:MAG: dihydroorotase [Acidimicrobiales bacterium]
MSSGADLCLVGRVVTRGEREPERAELVVSGGRIAEVRALRGKAAGLPSPARRIDVGDAYLLPGGIDCHVHSGSHPGEGIAALTRSAAAGGVTTVVDMPYDATGPVVDGSVFAEKSRRVEKEAVVDVALLGTVRPGPDAEGVKALVGAGAVGFKLSLFCTDPRRFPRIHDDQFLQILEAIEQAGSIACVHAENEEIIKPLIERARRSGDSSPIAHCRSRPPVSETQAVLTVLEYARETGARLHLCHLSLARSVELASSYRAAGTKVSVETCPHYLCFSELDMAAQGGRLKINPPLRSPADVEGLWHHVSSGAVDVVASDHAPWPISDKTRADIFDNHSGAPGVETLLTVLGSRLLARGGSACDLARLVSERPAELFGLSGQKGSLAAGKDADILAFDPDADFVLHESDLHSNAGWSPYDKMSFTGRVVLTVSRGEVVFEGGRVLGMPGRGRLVKRATDGTDRG